MNKKIKDTKIGLTCFEYNGRNYRLTGFCFVYEITDSNDRKIKSVNREDATHISGAGVGGVVAPIEEVTILERTTNWSGEALESAINSHKRMVEDDKEGYKFLKELPLGLNSKEYNDICDKRIMETLLKGFKK